MKNLLHYIENNPGCNSLQARRSAVNYSCGWSNSYSDAVLTRLRQRGLVRVEQHGNKLALYANTKVEY